MWLDSSEPVTVLLASEYPYVRLLFSPMSADAISRSRLLMRRASPETEEQFGAKNVLEIGAANFLLSAERPDRVTGVIQLDEGAGYRDELECNSLGGCQFHWFDVGAEIILLGDVEMLDTMIQSNADYPLTFKMTDMGWTLMSGRGEITPAGQPTIAVGHDDRVATWVPRLQSDDQLLREAAAQALGWLAAQEDEQARETAAAALVNALNDPAWEVRRDAAEALGKLGVVSTVEATANAAHRRSGSR
jgi:hypothetical protein